MHEGRSLVHPFILFGVPAAGCHLRLDDNVSFAPIFACCHIFVEKLLELGAIDFASAVDFSRPRAEFEHHDFNV